ncbi:MAG: phosphopantetheine-binding protein [Methylophilus sp.]|nr:phosphopantetheine-binding protein [Methylophilus sp.]
MDTVITTKDEITKFLTHLLKTEKQIDISNLDMSNQLADLNIDSFGFLEVIFSIEHQYNISFPKNYEHLKTLQDVVDTTYSLISEK